MKQLAFPAPPTTLTAFAVLLLISGSLAGCSSDEEDAASGQETSATTAQAGEQATATIETVYISAEYQAWVANTEELVKNVDDVYIGTVLSAGETFSLYGHDDVWTPYTVEVEQRLLGNVEGTITVVQQGSFDPDRNILVIVEDDPLLEVGGTYMLASLTGRECASCRDIIEDKHFVVAVKGHIRIDNEAHRQQLIEEYTEAINQAGLGS